MMNASFTSFLVEMGIRKWDVQMREWISFSLLFLWWKDCRGDLAIVNTFCGFALPWIAPDKKIAEEEGFVICCKIFLWERTLAQNLWFPVPLALFLKSSLMSHQMTTCFVQNDKWWFMVLKVLTKIDEIVDDKLTCAISWNFCEKKAF